MATAMTSGRRSIRQRGFTLAEMIIVVMIISLLAAMIVPNVANQQKGIQVRAFFSELSNFAADARERAISTKKPITLALDSNTQSFVQTTKADDDDANDQQLATLKLPSGVTTDNFISGENTMGASDWKVQFFPDGSSDGGGVELTSSGRVRTLKVDLDGTVSISDGPTPDDSQKQDDQWPAGDYEKRA